MINNIFKVALLKLNMKKSDDLYSCNVISNSLSLRRGSDKILCSNFGVTITS